MVNPVIFVVWDGIVWVSLLVITAWVIKFAQQSWEIEVSGEDAKRLKARQFKARNGNSEMALEYDTEVTDGVPNDSDSSLPDLDISYSEIVDQITYEPDMTNLSEGAQMRYVTMPILPLVKNRDHLGLRKICKSSYGLAVPGSSKVPSAITHQASRSKLNTTTNILSGEFISQDMSFFKMQSSLSYRRKRDFYDPQKFIDLNQSIQGRDSSSFVHSPSNSLISSPQASPSLQMASRSSPNIKVVLPHGEASLQKKTTPRTPLRSIAAEIQASASKKFRRKRKFDNQESEDTFTKEQENKRRKRSVSPERSIQNADKRDRTSTLTLQEDASECESPSKRRAVINAKSKYSLSDRELSDMALAETDQDMDVRRDMKRKGEGEVKSSVRTKRTKMIATKSKVKEQTTVDTATPPTARRNRESMRYESLQTSLTKSEKLPAVVVTPKSFPLKLKPGCGEKRKKFPMYMSPLSDIDTIKASQEEFGEEGVTADYYDDCIQKALERVGDFLEEEVEESSKETTETTKVTTTQAFVSLAPATTVQPQMTFKPAAGVKQSAQADKSLSGTKPAQPSLPQAMPSFKITGSLPSAMPFTAKPATTVSSVQTSTALTGLAATFSQPSGTVDTATAPAFPTLGKVHAPPSTATTSLTTSAGLFSIFTANPSTSSTTISFASFTPISQASSEPKTTAVSKPTTTTQAQTQVPTVPSFVSSSNLQLSALGSAPVVTSSQLQFSFGNTAFSAVSQGQSLGKAFGASTAPIASVGPQIPSFPTPSTSSSATTSGLPKPKFPFGTSTPASSAEQKSIFGSLSATTATSSSSVFGSQTFSTPMFGNPTTKPKEGAGVFGGNPSEKPKENPGFFFGGIGTTAASTQPSLFSSSNLGGISTLPTTSNTAVATPATGMSFSQNPAGNQPGASVFGTRDFKPFQPAQSSGFDFSSAAAGSGVNLNFSATQGFGSFGTPGFGASTPAPAQGGFNLGSSGKPTTERRPVQRARRRQKK